MLTVTDFLVCPCHLIIMLPLLISLLADQRWAVFCNGILAWSIPELASTLSWPWRWEPCLALNDNITRDNRTIPPASLRMRLNLNPGSPLHERTSLSQGDNTYAHSRAL